MKEKKSALLLVDVQSAFIKFSEAFFQFGEKSLITDEKDLY